MSATPIESLLAAIQSLFTGSGINAQFPGGMWADIAPENHTMPYVVTSMPSAVPTLMYGAQDTAYGDAQIQFSIYGIGRLAMLSLMQTYVVPTYNAIIDMSASGGGKMVNFVRMHDPLPRRMGRDQSTTDSPSQGDVYQVSITMKYTIQP